MKKIVAILTGIILLTVLFAFCASAAENGALTLSSAAAAPGESVTLDVAMPANPGLVTMAIRVSYDTNVLELTNVTDTGLLTGTVLNPTYNSPYTISWIDGEATENNTETGTIASFTFKVKDSAPEGVSSVSLQFSDSYNTNYQANQFSASSGTVTVTGKANFTDTPSSTEEPYATPAPTEEQPPKSTTPSTEESAIHTIGALPKVAVPNKQNTPSDPGSFPWWIILVAAIAVGIIGALVILKKKH